MGSGLIVKYFMPLSKILAVYFSAFYLWRCVENLH